MEEGRNKAIPLRRPRMVVQRPAIARRPTLLEWITGGLQAVVVGPPRTLWLVGLGATALTLRTARQVWTRIVREGAEVDGWLRRPETRRRPSA